MGLLLLAVGFLGCHPVARPVPDSAFRSLRRVTVQDGAQFPAGQLHLKAYVIDVGAAPQGTWLELADPTDHEQRVVLVYGESADAALAQRFKGQTLDVQFTSTGRITLPDGRKAAHIVITGLKTVALPTPAPAP
jgi:hypothetical protein